MDFWKAISTESDPYDTVMLAKFCGHQFVANEVRSISQSRRQRRVSTYGRPFFASSLTPLYIGLWVLLFLLGELFSWCDRCAAINLLTSSRGFLSWIRLWFDSGSVSSFVQIEIKYNWKLKSALPSKLKLGQHSQKKEKKKKKSSNDCGARRRVRTTFVRLREQRRGKWRIRASGAVVDVF